MEPCAVIAGRFELRERSASGGMATVYRAFDHATGDAAAVKILHCGPEFADRFEREAQVLAELKHPAIVRYLAHGSMTSGEPFLAMEWLEGEDLGARLARSGLNLAESKSLLQRVCEALAIAHKKGIVHRDIKPQNLFLPGGDVSRVKVLDFGIARMAGAGFTSQGMTMGTPGYMAPEQARGDSDLDARADVFALGCVMFECIAGRAPFVGEHVMAVLAKILLEDAPRLSELRSDIPEMVDDLVARMLCKEAQGRPADASALVGQLSALGEMPENSARAPRWPETSGLTAGERRVVCMLLAPSPLADELSLPEAPTPALAPTLLAVTREETSFELAAKFGARIERLRDGSFIAVLTGARSATDLASRAARFALALHSSVPDMPLVLVTGRADVTGRLPVGDVIDRGVAWLSSLRRGDGLRIDPVTAGLVDVRFVVTGSGGALFLRSEREITNEVRTLLGRPTPCVGRERELQALEAVRAECFEDSKARAVLITAAAGVGKSRLRHEFLARHANSQTMTLLVGRGDPMSAGSPFSMLAQAVRNAAGVMPHEPLEVNRLKLAARIARHVPEKEAARVTEFVGEFAGVPFADADRPQLRAARNDPRLMSDQIAKAWSDWMSAECQAQPVLLVLEDLHWGDLPSIKLVDAALRTLRERQFMVLALGRLEVHDIFPSLWQGRSVTAIQLSDMSPRAAEQLVHEVLGGDVAPQVVERVVTRADGNAFYLEELIRAVADGRGDALPETVLAMVTARLEALPSEMRRVLRAASVFGKRFTRDGVRALLGGLVSTKSILAQLDDLVAREILERLADSGVGGVGDDAEYQFRHALARQTAYDMLTDADRTLGHSLAGEWLEKAGVHDAAALAEHFAAGQKSDRAVEWFLRAADQALEGNDLAQAIALADRGVACNAAGDILGALSLVKAEAYNWRGMFADGEPCAVRAIELLPPNGKRWYRAVAELVTARGRLGRYGRVAAWAKRMVGARPSADAASAAMICGARIVLELFNAGLQDLCTPLFESIARIAAESGSHEDGAAAWAGRAAAVRALSLGNPGEYLRLMQSAVQCFENGGNARGACETRFNLGEAYVLLGLPERGAAILGDVMTAGESMGLTFVVACAKQALGRAAGRSEDLQRAIALEREAIQVFLEQSDRRMEGAARTYLAAILPRAGKAEEAEEEARWAARILVVAPPLRAEALAVLACLLLAQGRADEALATVREAAQTLKLLGGLPRGESLVELTHAQSLAAAGRGAEAREIIAHAKESLARRAATIDDDELRRAFLERVPEHVQIAAWADRERL